MDMEKQTRIQAHLLYHGRTGIHLCRDHAADTRGCWIWSNWKNQPAIAWHREPKPLPIQSTKKLRPEAYQAHASGQSVDAEKAGEHNHVKPLLTHYQVAQMAKVTICILFLAAFLWGTEALPLGATDIMVGVMLYLFAILPINEISKAYMKDAVFFIFGILAVAVGVAKTGLDKRIGLILLSRIKSAKAFAFFFLPMLSLSAGFLSEHALVALLIPVLMGIYKVTCKMYGIKKDRAPGGLSLAGVVCFAANHGGPGSPAAGGRNAIMVGYLAEYGMPISFLEWMKIGMPFVPVMSWVIGLFMYLRLKPKFQVTDVNPSEIVKQEVKKHAQVWWPGGHHGGHSGGSGPGVDHPWRACRFGRAYSLRGHGHVFMSHSQLGRYSKWCGL